MPKLVQLPNGRQVIATDALLKRGFPVVGESGPAEPAAKPEPLGPRETLRGTKADFVKLPNGRILPWTPALERRRYPVCDREGNVKFIPRAEAELTPPELPPAQHPPTELSVPGSDEKVPLTTVKKLAPEPRPRVTQGGEPDPYVNKTKEELTTLALDEYGVDLSQDLKKAQMIKQIKRLEADRKAQKSGLLGTGDAPAQAGVPEKETS